MSSGAQAASFEDFLKAPSRLAKQTTKPPFPPRGEATIESGAPYPAREVEAPKASPRKEKVGLTIDPALIEAVDDYIYHERKRGHRLKKNDVYEAALRQFLGLGEDNTR